MSDSYDYFVTAAGRVNLIGEHIDYCGGKVLPAALSCQNKIYAKRNGTDKINLSWENLPDKITLDINDLEKYKKTKYANYIAGCAFEWKNSGREVVGADMRFSCDVPFGSGLSSSAAIEVSTLAALSVLAGEPLDKKEIALLAQKAENFYVGVNCGIMDQYASAFGKKDNAVLLDCSSVSHEYVPLDLGEYLLVLSNTNKPHDLVMSKYNERRAETDEALRLFKEKLNVNRLADVTPYDFNENIYLLSGKVRNRAEHVVYECLRVKQAVEALRSGNLLKFGKLMTESHISLKNLYEVTGKELDTLFFAAASFDGCIGSRMTGAGFGGCTVSLVKKDKIDLFKSYVGERYIAEVGYAPSFYTANVSDGITVTKL